MHLGAYLRQVRQGRTLVVTDRGAPVAELRPVAGSFGVEAVLARLEAQGVVTRPTEKRLRPFRPIESRGSLLSTAVTEDRDDRF